MTNKKIRMEMLESAISDLKIFIEHAYERGCDRNHPQVKRFWYRLERAERELSILKNEVTNDKQKDRK